jgi:hypothetical protein
MLSLLELLAFSSLTLSVLTDAPMVPPASPASSLAAPFVFFPVGPASDAAEELAGDQVGELAGTPEELGDPLGAGEEVGEELEAVADLAEEAGDAVGGALTEMVGEVLGLRESLRPTECLADTLTVCPSGGQAASLAINAAADCLYADISRLFSRLSVYLSVYGFASFAVIFVLIFV